MSSRVRTFSHPTKVLIVPLIATVMLLGACGSLALNPRDSSTNTGSKEPSNALWVANGTNVLEFYPYAGGDMTMPILTLNSAVFAAPQGVVFDNANNLWVIDGGGNGAPPALYQFTEMQLTSALMGSSLSPNVTLMSSSFMFPQQAVFDTAGNLWVSDNGANAVFAFVSSQLTKSQNNITPKATLMANPTFEGPLGLAFDGNGGLWVANNASTTIYGFKATQLPTLNAGSHSVVASATILADQNGTIRAPWGLAFDASGTLWSSNSDPNSTYTVVAFGASVLQSGGSPAATVTLSPAMDQGDTTLSAPNGIAFDSLGNLGVVSSLAPNGLGFYSAAQTKASGATVPAVFVPGAASTVDMAAGCNAGPWIH